MTNFPGLKTTIRIPLEVERICPCCGAIYGEIPEGAAIAASGDAFDGFYWNCECGSTQFKRIAWVKEGSA